MKQPLVYHDLLAQNRPYESKWRGLKGVCLLRYHHPRLYHITQYFIEFSLELTWYLLVSHACFWWSQSFARQLGKGAVPPLYPFCQQRASVLEDRKSSPRCGHGHVDWNSSESGDIPIFEDVLRSKEDESPFDAHVDQWVGVEVLLFGRKSSIGEVGSTTSNVCDKLRSVIADPERELLCASFAKITDEKEDREWPPASKGDIVPSWLSCRRIITRKRRINVPGAISDCHITALLASLPKTGSHIGTTSYPEQHPSCPPCRPKLVWEVYVQWIFLRMSSCLILSNFSLSFSSSRLL